VLSSASICALSPVAPPASEGSICNQLAAELKTALGSVANIFQEMKVKEAYKGVTYELLTDADFIKTHRVKIP